MDFNQVTTIICENSTSRIINLDSKLFNNLRNDVCYFSMSTYIRTKNVYAAKKFLIDKNGFFPTGLIDRVINFLKEKSIIYSMVDNRIKPSKNFLNMKQLEDEPPAYEDQANAVEEAIKHHQGIIQLPTGVGKSRVGKDLILRLQKPTLYITPSTNLKEQAHEDLTINLGKKFVGFHNDKRVKPITIMNYHSILNLDKSFFDRFECLIWDEFHHAIAESIRGDKTMEKLNNIYYRFGMTATNFTNDKDAEILMHSVLSRTLYELSIVDAIKKQYILPVKFIFFKMKNEGFPKTGTYPTHYKTFINENEVRMAKAIELSKQITGMGIPLLGLVKNIQPGRAWASQLDGAIFINGQDENAKANMQRVKEFNEGKIPQLIGTSVIGEGVNTKACGAAINFAGGKSKSELLQRIGRVVRRFGNQKIGFFFDFYDTGSKYLEKHSKERIKIIEEEFGVKVEIIEL